VVWGCKPKENKIILPDLRPNFSALLSRRDSLLLLDSFYYIKTDTMTEKKALVHQLFPYLNIMHKIEEQLTRMTNGRDSSHSLLSTGEMETAAYLKSEKEYVGREVDSLSTLIQHADSITPVGYRAFYKVTVSKKDKFTVSDTIPYAISLKMTVSDWDRNLEKIIDSISIGRRLHTGGNGK
jgi:hypothetical protein